MDFKNLANLITQYGAPLLGSVLGGPAGGAIGQIIANEFGGDPNDAQQLYDRINLNPEARVKLAEIEKNSKVELQKILLQAETARLENATALAKIDAENTADAREMNTKNISYFPEILSILICIGFFACIYWVAAFAQDAKDEHILNMLIGVLGTAFVQMLNYWMGTSSRKVDFKR